ncbi:MAG: periplasmic heavy metal sensor [Robiginitomaculum sp.]|nr:periplasmic heavy metal sensor [Robiginitomaculum sp.]
MTLNRSFIWVLILSLTINLLLVGGMAGMFIASNQNKSTPQSVITAPKLGNSSFNSRGFLRALPPVERKKIRAIIKKSKGKYRTNSRQVRKLRRQVYFLLLAEQLDDQAIKTALDQLRQAENHASADGQALILEILADLDVDTRRKTVKAMSRTNRRKASNN